MDELLRVSNRHPAPTPAFKERPGRYTDYFENSYGEQLVFVHDAGERNATLFLGDDDWNPCAVSDADGLPDVGALILTREEREFVCACRLATTPARQRPGDRAIGAGGSAARLRDPDAVVAVETARQESECPT